MLNILMKLNMSFSIEDEKLLKTCYKVQDKIIHLMQKVFCCGPVHNEKYLKIKIESYDGKINGSFHDNGVPKVKVALIAFFYQ